MDMGIPPERWILQAVMLLAGFAGVAFGAWILYRGREKTPRVRPVREDPPPPFDLLVAAGRRRGPGG